MEKVLDENQPREQVDFRKGYFFKQSTNGKM